jgi:cytochrome bd ubiquinol oxidase subunit II
MVAFWFTALVVLWCGFLLLEGFDFGVGMLHRVVGRDEAEVATAIRTIGPVWDGNEVWLVVVVAVTFAAFPGWFATMLSAFYPVFLAVLVALILRGVSFEFRSHATGRRSRRFWDAALTGGSLVVPLGLGIVLGGLLGGLPIDSRQEFVGGVGDLFSPYAVLTGVTITVLCLAHGAAYLALRTTDNVRLRALGVGRVAAPVAAILVVVFVGSSRIESGRGVLLSVAELGAVLAAGAAAVLVARGREGAAFAATSAAVAGVVVSLFTELYPLVMVSTLGAAESLTATETASSAYTLRVMTVVLAVLLPLVIGYQAWAYRVFRGRLRADDVVDRSPHPVSRSGGEQADRTGAPVAQGAGLVGSPRPMAYVASLLLVWLMSWLIARAMAVVAPSGREGVHRHA